MKKIQLLRFFDDGRWKVLELEKNKNGVFLRAREGKKGEKDKANVVLSLTSQEIAYLSEWLKLAFNEIYEASEEGEKQ